MSGFWDDAEVISVYTRAQAIEDGTLTVADTLVEDEPLFVHQAGFNVQVALTAGLADLVCPSDAETARYGQSVKGRLWDVLNMARMYGTRARREADVAGDVVCEWFFPCIFTLCGREGYVTRSGARYTGQRTFKLWASIAPGDDGEPVVTIGFPEDR